MSKVSGTKLLEVPERIVDYMAQAYQKWEKFHDEFEDFSFSIDREFIKKMRKAKKEHLSGRTRSLSELKEEL